MRVYRTLRCIVITAAAVLSVIHLLFHGTSLDGLKDLLDMLALSAVDA